MLVKKSFKLLTLDQSINRIDLEIPTGK